MANRADPWARELGGPFFDLAREQFAQARAKGVTIKAACEAADISAPSGSVWERDERMRRRVRELRDGAETITTVSQAWVMEQLRVNALAAREEGAFKASNEALGMLYKFMREDKAIAHGMVRALPPNVTGRELQKRLREKFAGNLAALPEPAEPIDVAPAPVEVSDGSGS